MSRIGLNGVAIQSVVALSVMAGAVMPSLASNNSATAATSAYTTLDFNNDCIALNTGELGGTWMCTGYKGFGILLSEGDLRTSVFFGHLGRWFKKDGSEAFSSFGPFNNIHETTEWRLDDKGRPFATIQRFLVHRDEQPDNPHDVLVIYKVGQPGESQSCMTGYVDAEQNANANERARQYADQNAASFDCDTEEPQPVGERDDTTPGPVVYRPAAEL